MIIAWINLMDGFVVSNVSYLEQARMLTTTLSVLTGSIYQCMVSSCFPTRVKRSLSYQNWANVYKAR